MLGGDVKLGEKVRHIGIIDIALYMFPHGHVVKLGKERHQADIAIDNFLKPPQFGIPLGRANDHRNRLIADVLCLGIAITPVVAKALRQPVPVDKITGIGHPGTPGINGHIDV